ncbi:MAG: hypothetical protein ACRDNL_11380 [Spirillospora sp.]
MTGVLVVAVLGIGGVGSATAASPSTDQKTRKDCRTYSSVTECGQQARLTEKQRACVTTAVQQGMTERRATVECRAFT